MLDKHSSKGNVDKFMKRFLGVSTQSASMLFSIFNPYGVNGFSPIFLVGFNFLFSNYLNNLLETHSDWDERRRINDAPRKAIEDNISTGFYNLAFNTLCFEAKTSFLNMVKFCINSLLLESTSNLLPNAISNSIYSEKSTCHFLSKSDKGAESSKNEKPENIVSSIGKTRDLFSIVNRCITLPNRLYEIWNCATTLYNLAQPMTEFLPYPFNFKYGLVGFMGVSVLTKLAFDKALHKFSTTFGNPSSEIYSYKLKDYILNNSKDILSRNASAAVTHKLQDHLKDENNRCLINGTFLYYFNQFLQKSFESSKDYIFHIVIGGAILSNSALNYRDHFIPIISASTTITSLLVDLSDTFSNWWYMNDSISNLNELMERISEAKSLSEAASKKVIIVNKGKLLEFSEDFILQIPGSEKSPAILKSVIEPGKIVRLHGPNGVGKSTLITSILLGDNIKVGTVNRTDSLHISMQNYTPIPGFTLLQDIVGSEEIDKGKLSRIKGLFGKFENLFEGREINEKTTTDDLSGGQRKVVKLISAIVSEKKLVILDEPFAEMDDSNIQECIALIKEEAKEGRGFLIVDHIGEGDKSRDGFYDSVIDMKLKNFSYGKTKWSQKNFVRE
ncbi:MAG: ATP-binding cassette domain-containing protein [Candidatus Jidaibacter sp.]|jgi:ABC-type lipoprotein export system ATPase subunit|nr:ATP-binding cassette domain-containing protein [Candidatus Jidaibacter sp.]